VLLPDPSTFTTFLAGAVQPRALPDLPAGRCDLGHVHTDRPRVGQG
jgi:hypothetical protein